MVDQGEIDDKIISVASNDSSVNHFNDIEELPLHLLGEIKSFFEDYKKAEKKITIVEEFKGKEAAHEIIK